MFVAGDKHVRVGLHRALEDPVVRLILFEDVDSLSGSYGSGELADGAEHFLCLLG